MFRIHGEPVGKQVTFYFDSRRLGLEVTIRRFRSACACLMGGEFDVSSPNKLRERIGLRIQRICPGLRRQQMEDVFWGARMEGGWRKQACCSNGRIKSPVASIQDSASWMKRLGCARAAYVRSRRSRCKMQPFDQGPRGLNLRPTTPIRGSAAPRPPQFHPKVSLELYDMPRLWLRVLR